MSSSDCSISTSSPPSSPNSSSPLILPSLSTSRSTLAASFRFLQRRRARCLTRLFLGLTFCTASVALILLDSARQAGVAAPAYEYAGGGTGAVTRDPWKRGWILRLEPLTDGGGDVNRTLVYHGEQTFAILTIGANGELRDCELIEAIEEEEIARTLAELQETYDVTPIDFETTLDIMSKCRRLSEFVLGRRPQETSGAPTTLAAGLLGKFQVRRSSSTPKPLPIRTSIMNGPLALMRGILPGTKWCGNGDIAEKYKDVGEDWQIDLCCREHDHCPIKVRAFRNRYNFFNSGVYTKSHCDCDARFNACLKAVNSSVSNIVGQAYFDIIRVRCVVTDKSPTNGTLVVKESDKALRFRDVGEELSSR